MIDGIRAWIRNSLRSVIYPGLDLHTRNRVSLCAFWKNGSRTVLDAGSGNGYFSWLAYRSGAHVVAMTFDQSQVEKAHEFLVEHRGADPSRLRFERRDLYDLVGETRQFDEIICYETIEHIRRDTEVIAQFFRLLRPGGTLHLSAPNRDHPRHQAEVLDVNEVGGHVRAGYTKEDYRALLEPIGFRVRTMAGIGPKGLYYADEFLRFIRTRMGDLFAVPFLCVFMPFVWLARMDPPLPYSIYVCADKSCGEDLSDA
jgi:2-polyprenyl-3-methyl-5-hydroxy-6-metoxy-1,4-benzoquinol methylase